jgi:hypothetical protein
MTNARLQPVQAAGQTCMHALAALSNDAHTVMLVVVVVVDWWCRYSALYTCVYS